MGFRKDRPLEVLLKKVKYPPHRGTLALLAPSVMAAGRKVDIIAHPTGSMIKAGDHIYETYWYVALGLSMTEAKTLLPHIQKGMNI